MESRASRAFVPWVGERPARLSRGTPSWQGGPTTPPHPRDPGHMLPAETLGLSKDAGVSHASYDRACSLRLEPWFSRKSAPSLHSQNWCCWRPRTGGCCGHRSTHGRPQPLTLFLLNLFFTGYSSLRCTLVLKALGGSHGAQLCLDATPASSAGRLRLPCP